MSNTTWWGELPNAEKFIEAVTLDLRDGKDVLLELPEHLPWEAAFYEQLAISLEKNGVVHALRELEDDPHKEPGEIILRKFCKPERRAQYRPNIGYGRFLANSQGSTLSTALIEVHDLRNGRLEVWLDFVREYRKALSNDGAVFLLETRERPERTKGMSVHAYAGSIGSFDAYTFYMISASSYSGTLLQRRYLAELAFTLCGSDAELGGACLQNSFVFISKPLERLNDVCNTLFRADGGNFRLPGNKTNLKKQVWQAQLRIVFPLLEDYRQDLIRKYRKDVEHCLPIETAHGEIISEPEDVELGSLSWLIRQKRLNVTAYEETCIEVCKDARNSLAHLKPIGYNLLMDVLKRLPESEQ